VSKLPLNQSDATISMHGRRFWIQVVNKLAVISGMPAPFQLRRRRALVLSKAARIDFNFQRPMLNETSFWKFTLLSWTTVSV
jgi:hypothetical protein